MNRLAKITRFQCVSCRSTVSVLASNRNTVLRVACENCEIEMRQQGFAQVELPEVSPLSIARGVTVNTWNLRRLRNKPHIRTIRGEYVVSLREGFDFQVHLQRRFAAHRFCADRNRDLYSDAVSVRFSV